MDSFREDSDIGAGVYGADGRGHYLALALAPCLHGGAVLAVQVRGLKGVEVGYAEPADAYPRERRQVYAAHPPEARTGDPRAREPLLLRFRDKAPVPLAALP